MSGYLQGMNLIWNSTSSITVNPGIALDTTGNFNIYINSPVTITPSNIDTGSIAATSIYAVYALGKDNGATTSSVVFSLGTLTPAVPSGFETYRRIGWLFTDGSSNFIQFTQSGSQNEKTYAWASPYTFLTAGSATSYTTLGISNPGTLNTVPIDRICAVNVKATYTPALTNNQYSVVAFTPTSGFFPTGLGDFQNVPDVNYFTTYDSFSSSDPQVSYAVQSGDSLTLQLIGFQDLL